MCKDKCIAKVESQKDGIDTTYKLEENFKNGLPNSENRIRKNGNKAQAGAQNNQ
ncbi:hypothetical protein K443DRAFT_682744 [Laccaria amethystina LaAM-08-1]|uniref:Uncharacterized protein n=1 Tax=Laccaria amethystina LaAM-08-1 TaxID=1095629 RepID=A0A0C9XI30_9AGAR|nr:hypothetical protein K443DRAFT_682744 [Laccaria amethystina LaAM-08-1]